MAAAGQPNPGSDSQPQSGLRKITRNLILDFAIFAWTGQRDSHRSGHFCAFVESAWGGAGFPLRPFLSPTELGHRQWLWRFAFDYLGGAEPAATVCEVAAAGGFMREIRMTTGTPRCRQPCGCRRTQPRGWPLAVSRSEDRLGDQALRPPSAGQAPGSLGAGPCCQCRPGQERTRTRPRPSTSKRSSRNPGRAGEEWPR